MPVNCLLYHCQRLLRQRKRRQLFGWLNALLYSENWETLNLDKPHLTQGFSKMHLFSLPVIQDSPSIASYTTIFTNSLSHNYSQDKIKYLHDSRNINRKKYKQLRNAIWISFLFRLQLSEENLIKKWKNVIRKFFNSNGKFN